MPGPERIPLAQGGHDAIDVHDEDGGAVVHRHLHRQQQQHHHQHQHQPMAACIKTVLANVGFASRTVKLYPAQNASPRLPWFCNVS